jgi:hypothetical protein
MTLPLILLAISGALGGFGFFANRFLTLPNETKGAAAAVPAIACVVFCSASSCLRLYHKRTRSRSTSPSSRTDFISTNSTPSSSAATQGLLASFSGSLIAGSSTGRSFADSVRNLGQRVSASAPASRQPAGLRLSFRTRHHRTHLLHSFPLMLFFIVFAPLLRRCLILLGSPARWTACSARRPDHCDLLAFSRYQPGRGGISVVFSFPISQSWRLHFC